MSTLCVIAEGVYTLFDIPSLQQGLRKEIWHGFWTRPRPIEKFEEYERRREELCAAAEQQLSAFRVFIARLNAEPRILQRVEAAIMAQLYAAPGPTSAVPDRGMALAPRWQSEQPFGVLSSSNLTACAP